MDLSKDIEATFSLRIVDFHFTVISALIPNAYRKRVYRDERYTLFLYAFGIKAEITVK